MNEISQQLEQGARQLGLVLTQTQHDQLMLQISLLQKWNKQLNLTAITDIQSIMTHHLLDSLSIHAYLSGRKVLDIGSGGGFPGLPLAIVSPEMQFTLLDSRKKRVEFLRHCVLQLGLNNVKLLAERVEDLQTQTKFDTLTARAFSSFEKLLERTKHLHLPRTKLLAMKGKLSENELAEISRKWREQVQVEKLNVPFLDATRHIMMINF